MKDDRQNSGVVVAVLAGAAIVVFPLLYVLSIGPAAWLWEHGCFSADVFETTYYPLLLISRGSLPIGSVGLILNHYLDLWLA